MIGFVKFHAITAEEAEIVEVENIIEKLDIAF
jgi:hypothetical protein